MGQVQRRQQQDIELWELYEEEEWEAGQGGRRRDTGRHNGRSGRDRERTEARRRAEAGRDAGRAERKREGDRNAGRAGRMVRSDEEYGRDRRRAARSDDGIRLYTPEQDAVRRGSRNTKAADRRAADAGRRTGDARQSAGAGSRAASAGRRTEGPARRPQKAAGTRQAVRTKDMSGISYIGRNAQPAYRGSARPVQSIKRRRARRRREFLCKAAIVLFTLACLAVLYYVTGQIYQMIHRKAEEKQLPVVSEQSFGEETSADGIAPPEVIQDFLEINEYSRPGDKLNRINNIFVHYTANPGTSAAQNRSYFSNLAQTHERSASAHLIIGYEGELIQCIPFDEQAYAVMTRNEDSISIECCYLSDDGSFTQETYDTLIHTLAWLLDKYDLSTEDILRHYDCGGKLCPLYYAEHEEAWDQLRQDVAAYLAQAKQETT